jgi:NifU-like protein involved in Fe-S cluster formation
VSADEVYQQGLLQLAREAIGAGRLEAPDGRFTLDNPLCGDRVTFEVRLRQRRVVALAHHVRGCLLCQAAASLLGRAAPQASREEIAAAGAGAAAMLQGDAAPPGAPWAAIQLFAPVRDAPSRHRCVLLPFEALTEAIRLGGG